MSEVEQTVKKKAIYQNRDKKIDVLVMQLEDKSIRVSQKSCKSALRLLANNVHLIDKDLVFEIDETWNTQSFGEKLIEFLREYSAEFVKDNPTQRVKKSAYFKSADNTIRYLIEQYDNNSIKVTSDSTCSALRLLSKEINFEYDGEWNTQTFGSKLIDFINTQQSSEQGDETKERYYGPIEGYEGDEGDYGYEPEFEKLMEDFWLQWLSITDETKYVLLKAVEYDFEGYEFVETVDGEITTSFDVNQRDFVFGLLPEIFDIEELDLTDIDYELKNAVFYEFADYKILPNLTHLCLYKNEAIDSVFPGMGELKNLVHIELARSAFGEGYDSDTDEIYDQLHKLLSELPNLEYINISGTVAGMYFEDNPLKLKALKEEFPDCTIEADP